MYKKPNMVSALFWCNCRATLYSTRAFWGS
jgi:hypothetical protein